MCEGLTWKAHRNEDLEHKARCYNAHAIKGFKASNL